MADQNDRLSEKVSSHGERIAGLESRVVTAESEIDSLRESRHEHAKTLTVHIGQLRELEKRVSEIEVDTDRNTEVLVRANVPAMRMELDAHRSQLITLDTARRATAAEARKAATRKSTFWKTSWDIAKPIIVAGLLGLIAFMWHAIQVLQSIPKK